MFVELAKSLTVSRTRRRLFGAATALAGLGVARDLEAKKGKKKRKRKNKRKCNAESVAQTCAGKCGDVANNCREVIDCGSCACDPPCPVCQTCNGVQGQCEPNPAVVGFWCGARSEPGLICLADGACACDATSCAPPLSCGGGGVPGQCGCTPLTACPAGIDCGTIDDGCGGTLTCGSCPTSQVCLDNICQACASSADCGSGRICVAGVCEVCDVTCSGSARQCGAALQTALDDDNYDILYVCPGTYRRSFTIPRGVTVIGAGQDDDPATSTILEVGTFQERVVEIQSGVTAQVKLQHMRFTRGGGIFNFRANLEMVDCTITENSYQRSSAGSGVHQQGGALTMTRCTVSNNTNGEGGALYFTGGTATLTDCLIADNTAEYSGAGLLMGSTDVTLAGSTMIRDNIVTPRFTNEGFGGGVFIYDGSLTVGPECRITGNTAAPGLGGGIYREGGTVTLQGPVPEAIVVDNCHENCAVSGGAPIAGCAPGGTCPG